MKKRFAQTLLSAFLALILLIPANCVFSAGKECSANATQAPENRRPPGFMEPIIYHEYRVDRDFDKIQDSLKSLVLQTLSINKSALLPVVVTLYDSVSSQDLEYFTMLGGNVRYVYDYVTYGFSGVIPASNFELFVSLEGERLSMIEYDVPIEYHLDVSAPLIRARPTAWNTYGYSGSPNQSIAILDTGIDDSHPDLGPYQNLNFSSKIVGWYDATSDNALTPEDYGEHGTHVSGIAAGTGAANDLQESGIIETTFTYLLPSRPPGPYVYGYVDYIDVMNPGIINLNCSWNGGNNVLLVLSDPDEVEVKRISGTSQPLLLSYDTAGKAYPTGRYVVFVGNAEGPAGVPFSCIEDYPYEGRNDGYNLFSGVAPSSKLVGVKVFDNTGSGTLGFLIEAMDWIIANRQTYHIVVASMSLSLIDGATDTTLDQKADTMAQNGIVTIVSAGNDYPYFTIGSPGTAAYVITVAATNDQNGVASYSSNGDQAKNEYGLIKPDVAAPGGTFDPTYGNKIVSVDSNDMDGAYSYFLDQNANDYQQMAGTSMSAPHVAGLAALVVQALGSWNWTLEEVLKVKMLIGMTAFETQAGEGSNVPPLNRGEKDSKEGYGRINADAVIEATAMSYSAGDEVSDTFGFGSSDKKVWARQIYLSTANEYVFDLAVPAGADYDLYVYNGSPDIYGQPIIYSKSVNASLGTDESVGFIPTISGTYYILVKWVTGEGTFILSGSESVVRDVAVSNVELSDTVVYEGEIVNITVTAQNYGGIAESFDITVLYNDTAIEVKNIDGLAAGASEVLTFEWDTSGLQSCQNYTMKAEASMVPDESNTINNLFIDGEVKVKMQGDVNGDGVVNVLDLTIVSVSYGALEGEPGYNPIADINKDGIVDMRDLFRVARNLGKTCP